MDQKTVRKLERELEKAIAEVVIVRNKNWMYPLMPSRNTLHLMATELRAISMQGVMVQILVASVYLGYLEGCEPNDEHPRDAEFRRIYRLFYSIMAHLEATTKVTREEVMGTVYMSRSQDPQRCLAGELAS